MKTRFVLACTLAAIASMSVRAKASLPQLSQQAQQQVTEFGDALQNKVQAGETNGKPDEALVLDALLAAWHETANGTYFATVESAVDADMQRSGIKPPPRALLACLAVTGLAKYSQALPQPGTSGPVFETAYATAWHRQPPAVPAAHGAKTLAGAQAFADAVDSYDALPIADRDTTAWKRVVEANAALWLHGGQSSMEEEASAIAAYALAKSVRLGLLPAADMPRAVQLYDSLRDAPTTLTTQAARLLAATEMAQAADATMAQGQTVLGDAWFNSQKRKGFNGEQQFFHYKWEDDQNSGFSFFGSAFTRFGARLAQLDTAPNAKSLHGANIYVIASPDIPAKNPEPHFMDKTSADAIEAWVRAGGVLLLMENDKDNSEFEHFNILSERFGIHFNPVLRNTVEGRHFEQGQLKIPAGTGGIFPQALTVYMKEICTISVSGPAQAIYRDRGDALMAVAHVGKGTVWAVVDPWFYNEYTDGRKLPPEYQDFPAAIDVARWTLKQTR
jgi:unsaturated rhamnogalacturonyl hydrolase